MRADEKLKDDLDMFASHPFTIFTMLMFIVRESFAVTTFREINSFTKCLNNYTDIGVNCLIRTAIDASC